MIILTNRNLTREICALWCGTPIPSQTQFSLGPFSNDICTRTWAIIIEAHKEAVTQGLMGKKGRNSGSCILQPMSHSVWRISLFLYPHEDTLKPKTGLPWWLSGEESTCQCRRYRFDP